MNKILSFDEFKKQCNERGYKRVGHQLSSNLYYLFTKNGIKTEINYGDKLTYTIGYGRSKDEIKLLREEAATKGFEITSRATKYIRLIAYANESLMPRFWELISILEDIDSIVGSSRGIATRVFTKEEDETDKFEKIASRYYFAIEHKDQELLDLSRSLLSGDSIDHIITRGESVERTEEDSYREHLVPCIMIHNEAIRMVRDGATRAAVAQMISTNLAIVRITKAQADLLDYTLKLRTSMPDDWKFGDCVFERLKVANIKLK